MRKKIIILIIMIFILGSLNIVSELIKMNKISEKKELNMNEDGISFEIYTKSFDYNELDVLVTIVDKEYGIDIINLPNSEIIYGYGKNTITIDYKITENGTYKFEYLDKNKQKIQKELNIDEEFRNNLIKINLNNEQNPTTDIMANIECNNVKISDIYYKLGETNNWTKYNNKEIKLNSYELINYKNSDNTITVYAKIQDKNKNEIITKKIVSNLDLDIPEKPKIISDIEYPSISEKGVGIYNGHIVIDFDSRNDVTNYYSFDNVNWNEYTREIAFDGAINIYAKSVKKQSGLQISVNELVKAFATDAISPLVYDGNFDTCISAKGKKRINVNKNIWGKQIGIKWKRSGYDFAGDGSKSAYLYAYDLDGKRIGGAVRSNKYTIMENTAYLMFCGTNAGNIYEIYLSTT